MSADGWEMCFVCYRDIELRIGRIEQQIASLRPDEPWTVYKELDDNLHKAKAELQKVEDSTTWIEYKELGADGDGNLVINYRGGCNLCNASFAHKDSVRMTISQDR